MTDSEREIYGEVPRPKKARSNPAISIGMFLLFIMGVAFIHSTQSYNIDEIPLSRQFWFKQIIFFAFAGRRYILQFRASITERFSATRRFFTDCR